MSFVDGLDLDSGKSIHGQESAEPRTTTNSTSTNHDQV